MHFFKTISLCSYFSTSLVTADGTFKSRPDLTPPPLNITIPARKSSVEKGYIFVAPYNFQGHIKTQGPLQAAPFIFTDTGELIWSGYSYFTEWTGNFQVVRWKGEEFLAAAQSSSLSLHGHVHGHFTLLDRNYHHVKQVQAGHHELANIHEFLVVDEKTALIEIYHPLQRDLSAFGGNDNRTWIIDPRFQELDIATGRILFEWRGLEHVSSNASTAWDYFHLNSITKSSDGHYLISARHTSTLYKINGTSGSVIWRLGGPLSDFKLGPGVSFGFQHHARYVSESKDRDIIGVFDNAGHGAEKPAWGDSDTSLGKYIKLEHYTGSATVLRSFAPPPHHHLLAFSQGSVQTLPNSNVLINWGSEGAITELDIHGTPLFHAFLDCGFLLHGVQNYRAFRFNWTGLPSEEPAITALYNEQADRSKGDVASVGVEALDLHDETLTRTRIVSTEVEVAAGHLAAEREERLIMQNLEL